MSVKVFGISFVCFMIAVLPVMISGGGLFAFYSDYDNQDLEFMTNVHYALRNGGLGWDWYTDLGSSHLHSYSYYGLGSPFFWIMMLLPEKLLLPAMPVMLAIKTAVASLTAYLFIRRFSKSDESAAVGGMLYAFSGFQLYNIVFYHFHDAVAFFPLLLLAVELHIKDGKRGVFAPVVALCALTNFYFFFGQVIFVLIYIAVRSTDKSFGITLKGFVTLSIEAILGTLIAGVLLYPSFIAVSASGRAAERLAGTDMLLYEGLSFYARFIQTIVMSPDPCLISNLIETPKYKFGSLAPYLPVFSSVFVVAFARRNKKSWLTKITILSLAISLLPILNSAFSLFNPTYYARWHYMPILLMCVMTAGVVDEPESHPVKSSYLVFAGLFLVFTASLFVPTMENGKRLLHFQTLDKVLLVPQFVVTAVMYVLLAVIVFKLKRDKQFALNCISFAAVGAILLSCGFIWPCTSLDSHRKLICENYTPDTLDEYRGEEFERIELIDAYANFNMFWHMPSTKSYISLCSSSIADFYDAIGMTYDVGKTYDSSAYALRGLLSVKYVLDDVPPTALAKEDKTGEATSYIGCIYDGKAGDFYVYENEHYVPMGFTYDSYITYDALEEIKSPSDKAMALLCAIALTDEQIERYGEHLSEYDVTTLSSDNASYFEACDERAQSSCDSFEATTDGFTATITLDKDNLVFFSTPYEEGFEAYVNGEKQTVEKVSGGLIAIPCKAGENSIELTYKPQGVTEGVVLSLVGILGYAGYLIALRQIKRKKTP